MNYSDPRILIFFIVVLITLYFLVTSESFGAVNLNTHLSKEELEKKVKSLQDDLFKSELDKQKFITELLNCKQMAAATQGQRQGPVDIPFRQYINSKTETLSNYTQVGFLYNEAERYPLYGRHKYPGRSDRWEYFIIDESRNRLRIPFETRNYQELSSGDNIQIPVLNNALFTAEIYEYDTPRYNPNIL